MTTKTYVWRKGKVVDKRRSAPRIVASAAPNVIRDEMDPIRHMASGALMTSKRAFRQATRDAGCIEVGNDPAIYSKPRAPVAFNPQVRRREIRESIRRQLHGERA
jgi:hypothetical protein